MLPVVEGLGGLSDKQYWLRRAKSMIDAIKLVKGLAKTAKIRKSLAKIGIPTNLADSIDY